MTRFLPVLIIASVFFAGSGIPVCFAQESSTPMASSGILIRDVKVFDGRRAQEHRSVLVTGERIAKILSAGKTVPGARVIDGRGRTLLPGLIDSHVHVSDENSLRQALALGVTTVIDMFTSEERLKMMKRFERDDPLDMADVRTAGIGASPTQTRGRAYRQREPGSRRDRGSRRWAGAHFLWKNFVR